MIKCDFCGHDELDINLEYVFNVDGDTVVNPEIGTITGACKECNKETYVKQNELPDEMRSRLLDF